MNTKTIVLGSMAIGLAVAGVCYWWTQKDTTETTNKREGTDMSSIDKSLDEQMLASSKVMYDDIVKAYPEKAERDEQVKQLMVQLIYSHVNSRNCKDDVNRTYIDWIRKMHLANPEHYESIIRHCADNGVSTMSAIRNVINNHKTGMVITSKQQHVVEVADLSKYTTLSDITDNKLDIPTDAYTLKIERVLDIPVVIVLTGQQNVVTLKEAI